MIADLFIFRQHRSLTMDLSTKEWIQVGGKTKSNMINPLTVEEVCESFKRRRQEESVTDQ